MKLSGEFVRIFYWIAPIVLPVLVAFGRGLFGAPLSWMVLAAIVFGPLAILAMYVPPIIVHFDRDARTAGSTRVLYNVASWVTWGALLVMMFTLTDGGDMPPFESVLSTWGLMSSGQSSILFSAAKIVAVMGWLGTIITATIGVTYSRRSELPSPLSAG